MFGFSWILITDGLTHVQMCMESHPGQSAVSNLYHSFRIRIRVRAQNISTWPSVKIAVAIEIMNILLFRWLIHVVRTHFFYFIFTHFIRSICQLSPKRKSKKKTPKLWHRKLIFDCESVRLFHANMMLATVGNTFLMFSSRRYNTVQWKPVISHFRRFCFHLIRPTHDTKWTFFSSSSSRWMMGSL